MFSLCQIPPSDSPSPPPGLTKPSLVVPISVSDLTARSPFEGAAAESQSLFSDNSNFRHPNPLPAGLPPFPPSPRSSSDWPMTPEPQSLFTSGTAFYTDSQPQTFTQSFSYQKLMESLPLLIFSPNRNNTSVLFHRLAGSVWLRLIQQTAGWRPGLRSFRRHSQGLGWPDREGAVCARPEPHLLGTFQPGERSAASSS